MRGKTLGVVLVILTLGISTVIGTMMSIKTTTEKQNVLSWRSDKSIPDNLKRLNDIRIFFGHQSVGQNIVDGIRELVEENDGTTLEIVEGKELNASERGVLFHVNIGRNTRPKSKIRAFKKILTESAENSVDIAFMKFCYVDINRESNTEEIFDIYSKEMEGLRNRFPETVFVHMTIPIESMPRSAEGVLKHVVKRFVGKPGVVEDNIARQQFNELVRDHYGGREPVFDLAAWESLDSEGSTTVRMSGGVRIQFMDSQKSHDGGHLNAIGRKALGRELLAFLAEIEEARR